MLIDIRNCAEKSRLTQADKDFIAFITHDLKNPAISQLRSIDYLLTETSGTLTPSQKELLEISASSCRYMTELISSILDSYKYDEGKQVLKARNFNINELMSELQKENKSLLLERGQRLVITSSLSQETIYGDKLQLKRVLMNLLTNAMKYSPSGSVLQIQLFNTTDAITINVINESLIPLPRNLNKLFEKYETVNDYDTLYRGSGLGLYLSNQIVKAHKGKMYAKLLSARKCLFGFQIPVEYSEDRKV